MPEILRTLLTKVPLTEICFRSHGTAVCVHIFFNSEGTPGKVRIVKFSFGDQIIPGAVPNGLGRIFAPSGKRDCLRFLLFPEHY